MFLVVRCGKTARSTRFPWPTRPERFAMKHDQLSNDPFANFVNLLGSALSVPVTRRPAFADTGAGALPAEDPLPLRPEPADRKAVPPAGAPKTSLLDRLDQWVWRRRQAELEQYLGGASDLVELERRLQARERSLLQRYY